MTDIAFSSSMVDVSNRAAPVATARPGFWTILVRLVLCAPVTLIVLVPNSEVNAKAFKLALIARNLNRWLMVTLFS